MRQVVVALSLLLLAVAGGRGAVVVNEVLSNEPGGTTSLEWIELYNDGVGTAQLAFYELRVTSGSSTDNFPLGGSIPADGFMVFCRDAARFEEEWGDNSGTWGDDPLLENYAIEQLAFQLPNDSGRVELYFLQTLQSEIAWNEPGQDGVSWERFHPSSDDIGASLDPNGSTPGGINSLTPMTIDLALASVETYSAAGGTVIAYEIVNRGINTVSSAIVELYYYDGSRPDSLGALIAGEQTGEVDSAGTVILIGQYQLPGLYRRLVAQILLFDDERPENNRIIFTAPAADFPPLIISEFLANPTGDPGSEWVELKNISSEIIDLDGWQMGDSLGNAVITSTTAAVGPGDYVVIAQDLPIFQQAYPSFVGQAIQAEGWRGLNNSSDSVRLVDSFDFAADGTYYSSVWDNNHTWSRVEKGSEQGTWGRSEDAGGTPGDSNRVRLTPEGSATLSVEITPRIIAPDGDGIDDSAMIVIRSSPARAYDIKIFDSQGRLVRTLENDAPDLRQYYVWRGRDNGGDRVPVGIYILYFEASGVESIKKTVVVAR